MKSICKGQADFVCFQYHPVVMLANTAFFMLSVLHLAYLGLAFDSSSEEEQVTICLLHGVCMCVCMFGGGGYACCVVSSSLAGKAAITNGL